ncbi:MAG TPA: metallophosphoesterase [Polyangiales bacterium]
MRLLALSDLHVEHGQNREGLEALAPHPDDWLILGGDVSDSLAGLAWTLDTLGPKFARLLWVPGNHELWTGTAAGEQARGVARYQQLVDVCRARGVLTPEDEYVEWPGEQPLRIALLFLLYDYTFAPDDHNGRQLALAWAAEQGIRAVDEVRLHPDPYPSREAWCAARVTDTEARLARAAATHELVLVNHWPLREDVLRLGGVPRYSPWCGTQATRDWHARFRAVACVHGHSHVRASDMRDGVRFEEVSLGYPAHWDAGRGVAPYLRRILG